MNLDSLRDMYVEQLKDMYSAEKQLIEALPKLAEAATSQQLKAALQEHLAVTEQQFERVSRLLSNLGQNPGNKKCAAMEGLVEEGNEVAKMKGDDTTRDAGIIAAAQKVEHYEIATYGALRSWAETLGETEAAQVLQTTLDEEYQADQLLNSIAEGYMNEAAAR